MSGGLREEWEKTEIPDAIYMRARNAAWARLRKARTAVSRKWIWAAAGAGVAVALMLIPFLSHREAPVSTGVERTEPPRRIAPVVARPEPASPPPAARARTEERPMTAQKAPGKKRSAVARREAKPDDSPNRLVLNFVLPESGVKMIWILDKKFNFDGGQE